MNSGLTDSQKQRLEYSEAYLAELDKTLKKQNQDFKQMQDIWRLNGSEVSVDLQATMRQETMKTLQAGGFIADDIAPQHSKKVNRARHAYV